MILSKASLVSSPTQFRAGLKNLAVALAVVACTTGTASAEFFTFQAETNNRSADVTIGLNQISMEVVDEGNSQVSFTFRNQGPGAGSITDIFFYDGTLLAPRSDVDPLNPTITDSGSGVNFDRLVNQPSLPGYDGPVASVVFKSDSQNPAAGVDQDDEWVKFTFNLLDSTVTFQHVLDGLASGNPTSGLVVGIHFTSVGVRESGSESFTNNPNPVVPEPASIAMLGFSSLVGLGYAWRRRGRVVA